MPVTDYGIKRKNLQETLEADNAALLALIDTMVGNGASPTDIDNAVAAACTTTKQRLSIIVTGGGS